MAPRREIALPVCPECGHVGKVVLEDFRGGVYCQGPRGFEHKKVKTVATVFKEVRSRVK